jgi:hypothetical protein
LAEDVDNDKVSALLEDQDVLNIEEGLIAGKREKRSPGKGKKMCPNGTKKVGGRCKKFNGGQKSNGVIR